MKHKALVFVLLLTLWPFVVVAQQPSEIVIVKSLLRGQIKQWRAIRRADLLSESGSQFRLGVAAHRTMWPAREQWRRPSARLEYGCRVWNFLEAALGVSYVGYANNLISDPSGGYANKLNIGLTLDFTLRYSWFNRRWVSLYSAVGVRWELNYQQLDRLDEPCHVRLSSGHTWPEVVPVGVRVGRRFFGYFEPLSLTMVGFTSRVGLGFKF